MTEWEFRLHSGLSQQSKKQRNEHNEKIEPMKTIKNLTFVPLAALAALLLLQTTNTRAADHGARQLTFEEVDQIRTALERFAAGDGDLADWLIWERSRAAGAERVVTFDGRLLRSPEFVGA